MTTQLIISLPFKIPKDKKLSILGLLMNLGWESNMPIFKVSIGKLQVKVGSANWWDKFSNSPLKYGIIGTICYIWLMGACIKTKERQ